MAASDDYLRRLRAFGLAYPGAHTKSPWPGHLDLAVNDKTFAYLSLEGEPLSISCKLPHSCAAALLLPGTKPTAYGLGKSGWVSASFEDGQLPPIEMLQAWIDESYRAQAPKKLVRQLDAGVGAAPTKTGAAATKKGAAAKKKAAAAKKKGAAAKKKGAAAKKKAAAAKKKGAAAKKGVAAKKSARKRSR